MESALGHRGWIALMIIHRRAETAYNFLEITLKYLLITSLATFMSRSEVTYNPPRTLCIAIIIVIMLVKVMLLHLYLYIAGYVTYTVI